MDHGGRALSLRTANPPSLNLNPHSVGSWTELYFRSALEARRRHKTFSQVERFCFFIGYGRSGHSLIGSLLNAHPEVVISHELDVLRFVDLGFKRNQLFSLVLEQDRKFASQGRQWTEFDYKVAGQYQGEFTRLRVIGDKKGGNSTRRFVGNFGLLRRLRTTVGVPIRVVHVIRNPFDNVARMKLRTSSDLMGATFRYAEQAEIVETIRKQLASEEFLDLRYEELVTDPPTVLTRLCRFVGVETNRDYLGACTSIVSAPKERARDQVEWPAEVQDLVRAVISRHAFLQGYEAGS